MRVWQTVNGQPCAELIADGNLRIARSIGGPFSSSARREGPKLRADQKGWYIDRSDSTHSKPKVDHGQEKQRLLVAPNTLTSGTTNSTKP